jgi:hypothetical protein
MPVQYVRIRLYEYVRTVRSETRAQPTQQLTDKPIQSRVATKQRHSHHPFLLFKGTATRSLPSTQPGFPLNLCPIHQKIQKGPSGCWVGADHRAHKSLKEAVLIRTEQQSNSFYAGRLKPLIPSTPATVAELTASGE